MKAIESLELVAAMPAAPEVVDFRRAEEFRTLGRKRIFAAGGALGGMPQECIILIYINSEMNG